MHGPCPQSTDWARPPSFGVDSPALAMQSLSHWCISLGMCLRGTVVITAALPHSPPLVGLVTSFGWSAAENGSLELRVARTVRVPGRGEGLAGIGVDPFERMVAELDGRYGRGVLH